MPRCQNYHCMKYTAKISKQTNKRWVFSNSFCGMHFYQTFRIKHKEQHRLTKKAEFRTPFQKKYPINDVSFSAAHFGFWLCIVPSNYIFGLKLCHAKRQKIRTHRQPLQFNLLKWAWHTPQKWQEKLKLCWKKKEIIIIKTIWSFSWQFSKIKSRACIW